ncbi:hypothetical protein B5F08_12610 [Anaeromassilibacillus sp. An172]|nr:hypothetical protein B5F08_12610 [Anaeromassilibacillus sp. An172]
MVLAASRKNRVKFFKVATLQKLRHLQPCNLPFSGSNSIKFRRGAGCPFQRTALAGELSADNGTTPHNPLGERKTCEGILVIPFRSAFLIGLPVKSAFALLLTRVTEPRKNYL